MQKLMTVKEVAETIGISESLIYRLVNSGQMACYRVNSAIRVSITQLQEYLESTRKNTKNLPESGRHF